MIRRLRLKFICVNMAIVLVMMALMTVAVLYFTQRSLARESLHAMQQIAMDPLRPQAPGEAADGVRLPYFVLEVDETGAVHAAGGPCPAQSCFSKFSQMEGLFSAWLQHGVLQ